jgi:ubiquitin-protein ligase
VGKITWKDPSDLTAMTLTVTPDQGLWKGAAFEFSIKVPDMYPHEAPKVLCHTLVYHPNINMDGKVCLNILRDEWKPVLDINAVIYGVIYLFYEPNPNDPLNAGERATHSRARARGRAPRPPLHAPFLSPLRQRRRASSATKRPRLSATCTGRCAAAASAARPSPSSSEGGAGGALAALYWGAPPPRAAAAVWPPHVLPCPNPATPRSARAPHCLSVSRLFIVGRLLYCTHSPSFFFPTRCTGRSGVPDDSPRRRPRRSPRVLIP